MNKMILIFSLCLASSMSFAVDCSKDFTKKFVCKKVESDMTPNSKDMPNEVTLCENSTQSEYEIIGDKKFTKALKSDRYILKNGEEDLQIAYIDKKNKEALLLSFDSDDNGKQTGIVVTAMKFKNEASTTVKYAAIAGYECR